MQAFKKNLERCSLFDLPETTLGDVLATRSATLKGNDYAFFEFAMKAVILALAAISLFVISIHFLASIALYAEHIWTLDLYEMPDVTWMIVPSAALTALMLAFASGLMRARLLAISALMWVCVAVSYCFLPPL
jgi:hypothetical protein